MGFAKLKLPAVLALVLVAFLVTFIQVKANEETDDAVGPSSVWNPEAEDLADIAQACTQESGPAYQSCFLEQMGNFASSEAVSFSQALLRESPGHSGYLVGLREAGPIDLGYVLYPGSSRTARGWVLVNGSPAVVDVDNLAALPRAAMESDPVFRLLRARHPAIGLAVEESDRAQDAAPQMLPLGDGSQRFVVNYSLKEPCPDCAVVGHASFGFEFDPTGKLLGLRFIRVVPD